MQAVDVKALWTGSSLSPSATPARARGSVDAAIAEDIQTVIRLIAVSHEYPTVYGIGPGSSGWWPTWWPARQPIVADHPYALRLRITPLPCPPHSRHPLPSHHRS